MLERRGREGFLGGVRRGRRHVVPADVREVGVGVVAVRERLLACPAGRQQLALLRVPPLHPSVLEPNLHLEQSRNQ